MVWAGARVQISPDLGGLLGASLKVGRRLEPRQESSTFAMLGALAQTPLLGATASRSQRVRWRRVAVRASAGSDGDQLARAAADAVKGTRRTSLTFQRWPGGRTNEIVSTRSTLTPQHSRVVHLINESPPVPTHRLPDQAGGGRKGCSCRRAKSSRACRTPPAPRRAVSRLSSAL